MRNHLREVEFKSWSELKSKGRGVELFKDCPDVNKRIIEKRGLTNTEWIQTLKMNGQVAPWTSGSMDNCSGLECRERDTTRSFHIQIPQPSKLAQWCARQILWRELGEAQGSIPSWFIFLWSFNSA